MDEIDMDELSEGLEATAISQPAPQTSPKESKKGRPIGGKNYNPEDRTTWTKGNYEQNYSVMMNKGRELQNAYDKLKQEHELLQRQHEQINSKYQRTLYELDGVLAINTISNTLNPVNSLAPHPLIAFFKQFSL